MNYWIYKITDKNNNEEFYIGSTTRYSSRKSQHKKNTHNKVSKKYWCKLYQYIRANGDWDNFEMKILEAGTCEGKEYIKQKEQEYIEKLKPTLNSSKAYIYKETIPLISINCNTVS
jgi:predicted GIY-YIG superfamily endonuclease